MVNNLAMLSIGNCFDKTIDLENILRDFANKKSRKVFFYKNCPVYG